MKDKRLPWFACYPAKLLGALAGMKPDVGYVYVITLLRIYEVAGPCADSTDVIARRTGMTVRRVDAALAWLFEKHKLVLTDAGIINPLAEEILSDRNQVQNGRIRAGKAGAATRWEKDKEKQRNTDGKRIAKSSVDVAKNAHLDLDLDKESKLPPVAPPKRGAPRAMIRNDWKPNDKNLAYASNYGFEDEKIRSMASSFINHHRSRGTPIADLDATWRTWCDNELKFQARDRRRDEGNSPISMFDIAVGNHRRDQ